MERMMMWVSVLAVVVSAVGCLVVAGAAAGETDDERRVLLESGWADGEAGSRWLVLVPGERVSLPVPAGGRSVRTAEVRVCGPGYPALADAGEMRREVGRRSYAVAQRLDYWANHYNVPPEMLKALTWWESGWNNNAISSAGAVGIGQLLPTTADFVADDLIGAELNPHAVDDNIRMTARFVRYLLDETGNDRRLALASYCQGLFAVRKYGIYKISIPYVNGILALQDLISDLHLSVC